jgi:ubiquinol-cytochrome c reductase cytochrome c1 subunit
MNITRTLLALLAAMGFAGAAAAAGGGIQWDRFPTDKLTDLPSLQHGAKLFVNHCLNCHSAAFMRYNRMRDIGLTDDEIRKNLMFGSAKVGDTMQVPLEPRQAKEWFGGVPPDLTLVARSRADISKGSGADYLYTYLRSYYRDPTKATGWNNLAFPDVAMPNVLWTLQGQREARYVDQKDAHDPTRTAHVFAGFTQTAPGTLTPAEFDESVADLVAFMTWMAEPVQGQRVRLGVWVLLFMALFTVAAWRMNAAFWKDVK